MRLYQAAKSGTLTEQLLTEGAGVKLKTVSQAQQMRSNAFLEREVTRRVIQRAEDLGLDVPPALKSRVRQRRHRSRQQRGE